MVNPLIKAVGQAAKKTVPAAEREANLAKFLEPSKTPMRLYHGTTATEGGKGTEAIRRIKPSKEGALGSGAYLTPKTNYADQYTYKGAGDYEGGNMLPVYAQIKNPLVIDGSASNDPMIEALIRLGMDEAQASRMVERAYENKGYIGKEVETRARAQGYDGLMQYDRDGELSEVVSYNPNAVKSAIGNQGTYDTSVPDLSKAKGGRVHVSSNPDTMRMELEERKFDKGGAAFGVFPQMKPRRAGRTDNADEAMFRGLARGFAAGATGVPGDVELIARLLANTPGVQAYGEATGAATPGKYRQGEVGLETRLPTSEEMEKRIPFRQENPSALERAATGIGQIGGGFYTGPGAPIRAVTAIPSAVARAGRDFVMAAGQPAVNVVKPKGGNWLTGNVEQKLANIKVKYPSATFDEPEKNFAILVRDHGVEGAEEILRAGTYRYPLIKEDMALNQWIDKTLGKYIKNEMGTPSDPVRRAIDKKFKEVEAKFEKDMARAERTAERAAQETDPRRKGNLERQAQREAAVARQERQLAADNIYNTNMQPGGEYAADFQRKNAAKFSGPEYGKVMAETPAGKAFEDAADELIVTSPAEDLKNWEGNLKNSPWLATVDPNTPVHHFSGGTRQAAGFDHMIDILRQDLAAGRLKPEDLKNLTVDQAVLRTGEYDKELVRASREAQLKSTEGMPVYRDYPEKGMKWYELALGDLPPGYTREPSGVYVSPTGERSIHHPNYAKLEDALKYEGDILSHCVGGYCPQVTSGESRIFSLRNEAGQPFATIETKPLPNYGKKAAEMKMAGASDEEIAQFMANPPQVIAQIKGFKNQAPDESVLPLIQDFVRSGKWSDVGDIENTGLRFVKEGESAPGFAEWMKLKALDKLPNIPAGYYTPQELLQFGETSGLKEAYPSVYNTWASKLGITPPEGKKHGGRVHISDNPDTMRLELEDKRMQAGGIAKLFGSGAKSAKAAQKAEKAIEESIRGVHYADPLKPAEMRMSEALGNVGAEGKTLRFTESDRSRVFGPNRGGVGFSGLQHYSPPHKKANTVWGFGKKSVAEKKIRQNDPETTIWTTFVGAPDQHKSNTVVIQDALKAFQGAVNEGKVPQEQIKLMNQRLRMAADEKTGVPFFEKDFDITDPAALLKMTTFSRRSALGDVLMGEGSRGIMRSKEFQAKHGKQDFVDASKINELLKRETDPDLIGAGTYDVGNRLFVMDNGIIERPDLNIAFPWQVTGSDLGMKYQLVPKEAAMRDWMKQYEGRLGKSGKPAPVGYMDLARNNPSQFVDEDFLTFLQKSGYKKGGVVKLAAGGLSKAAVEALTKMRSLSKEFAEKSAEHARYIQETKNVPTKQLPSFEEWKALQMNATPENIEQLRKETGNKRGGSIKKKR